MHYLTRCDWFSRLLVCPGLARRVAVSRISTRRFTRDAYSTIQPTAVPQGPRGQHIHRDACCYPLAKLIHARSSRTIQRDNE